ncbi:MAG TPA: SDR family oxidoreductase, partial [Gaiellaceae bacterium]|nr:SDR family oxidoreductase [Gaiellaceae bacterium]
MAGDVLLTGFPGFLGSELVRRILARRGEAHRVGRVICLVQAKFADLAARRAEEIEASDPGFAGRIELVEGDITVAGLGLDGPAALARRVREVFHLAAVYDLEVRRALAMKVNVEGTRHVLDFAATAAKLESVQYVSTCYVSGSYAGIFRESDLDKGQSFQNAYEESKFLAEVEVRKHRDEGLPVTIYRPGIVVGDSHSGETQKYDGPYFILRWLLKQPSIAALPVPPGAQRLRVNLVPRDFVVGAIDALSTEPAARGLCYQLADPDPPTIDETIRMFGEATARTIVRIPMPLAIAKGAT